MEQLKKENDVSVCILLILKIHINFPFLNFNKILLSDSSH